MTINLSARVCRVVVGGIDLKPGLVSVTIEDQGTDESGLITTSGTMVIGHYAGIPVSLDPRRSAIWRRGQVVRLYLETADGGEVLHPRGTMAVEHASPDETMTSISVRLVDLLTLVDWVAPPDDKSGICIGSAEPIANVVNRLLQAAGAPPLIAGLAGTLNVPLQRINDSYIKQAGQVAWSAGYALWVNNAGLVDAVRCALPFGGNAVEAKSVPREAVWYKPLDAQERPIAKAITSGISYQLTPRDAYTRKVFPVFADGIRIREVTAEYWDLTIPGTSATWYPIPGGEAGTGLQAGQRRKETVQGQVGEVLPEADQGTKTIYATISKRDEMWWYRQADGLLVRYEAVEFAALGAVYLKYAPLKNEYSLTMAKITTNSYTYDSLGRTLTHVTKVQARVGSVFSEEKEMRGNDSWCIAERITRTWEYFVDGSAAYSETREVAKITLNFLALRDQDGSVTNTFTGAQIYLGTPEITEHDVNASAPAPTVLQASETVCGTRMPDVKEIPIRAEAYISSSLPAAVLLPERIWEIRYATTVAQLQDCAQWLGQRLMAAYDGYNFALELTDDMIEHYAPLMAMSWIEPDGAVMHYAVDGASWVLTPEQSLCSFDGLWLGQSGYADPFTGQPRSADGIPIPPEDVVFMPSIPPVTWCEALMALGITAGGYPYSIAPPSVVVDATLALSAVAVVAEVVELELGVKFVGLPDGTIESYSYQEFGRGGTRLGGNATTLEVAPAFGGTLLGGSATHYLVERGTGGSLVAGDATTRTLIPAIGGTLIGGEGTIVEYQRVKTAHGGVIMGGRLQQLRLLTSATGGVLLGGDATSNDAGTWSAIGRQSWDSLTTGHWDTLEP